MKRQRPSSHTRRIKTKKGKKTIKINRHIKKKPKIKRRGMAWNIKGAQEGGSTIDFMTPDEYLSKTTPTLDPTHFSDIETGKRRPIKELSEKIVDKDIKVTVPFVGSDPGDHEGRHRAIAAKLAGQKEIPVRVPVPKSQRKELAEDFSLLIKPKVKREEEWMEEIDDRDREKWVNRVSKEEWPEQIMDLQNTKKFKKLKKEKGLDII